MLVISEIRVEDAYVARNLMESAAVSTGAHTAGAVAKRDGSLETWTFQRTEDVESLLALLEEYRRRWNPARPKPETVYSIHAIDRLIAKLTATLR